MTNNNHNSKNLEEFTPSELGVIARGRLLWKRAESHVDYSKLSEVEYAYMLACANSYQHQSGGMVGTPDYNKIASEINRMYHLFEKVRSPSSIRNALFKYTSSE
ncbi:MAG: hypothetical protein WC979_06635 [Candidatus Pacearchaeota archaeon]|jgi:hypothetical protein